MMLAEVTNNQVSVMPSCSGRRWQFIDVSYSVILSLFNITLTFTHPHNNGAGVDTCKLNCLDGEKNISLC